MSNIRKMAEQYFEDAVELRRRIHQQPELSMEEKETSALVREKLREYGISIAELPLETGVIGVLAGERPGRTILLRADMDALPVEERSGLPFASEKKGVCHSCGHDIHTAALLLAARILRDKEGFSRHSIISVPAGRREVERFPVGDRQRAV